MLDFCILCIDDFKILKIFIKLSKFSTIFHRETSQAPPQRPYDVSRRQNRYVTLPLWNNIRSNSESRCKQSPPVASDTSDESVRIVVSPLRFNFISWLLGYSDEPQESGYVDMDEELAVKVFSVCQDLVYNSSKGRSQTPKSLALAIAVRQLSGCYSYFKWIRPLCVFIFHNEL